MPNIITHVLFAERVLQEMDKMDIRNLIEKYPALFDIGSNGPDFLFFYHAKPWEAFKNHRLNEIGSHMHAAHINAFYETAIDCIKKQQKEDIKEMMMVYLFGHLCHWALDKTTHPYVFYKTGNCKGKSAFYHHRFEAMIDTMMLKRIKGVNIKDYPIYHICTYDEEILRAIARIYVPVAKTVYHQDIKVFEIREALNSWYDIQKMLYDPHNIKFPVLQSLEKVAHQSWAISGHIIRKKSDDRYDVLNEAKSMWVHPCDDHLTSTKSFVEMFDEAIELAKQVIIKAYGCIEYDGDIEHVVHILKNQAYDTGMDGDRQFQFFDVIYE